MTLGKVTLILDDDVLQKLQMLAEEFWGKGAEVEKFLSFMVDAAEMESVPHPWIAGCKMQRITLDDYLLGKERNNEP